MANRRFIGTSSYDEESVRPLFFGREHELITLRGMIEPGSLSVIFGLSGVGKSSLINCGLRTDFIAKGYSVISISGLDAPGIFQSCLDNLESNPSLNFRESGSMAMRQSLIESISKEQKKVLDALDKKTSCPEILQRNFERTALDPGDEKERINVLVIFDQAESLLNLRANFSQPELKPSRSNVDDYRAARDFEIGYLQELLSIINPDSNLGLYERGFEYSDLSVPSILIALTEPELGKINRIYRDYPLAASNQVRIEAFSPEKAETIIEKLSKTNFGDAVESDPFEIPKPTLNLVLEFSLIEGSGGISPYFLQLFCSWLEDMSNEKSLKRVDALTFDDFKEYLSQYYQSAIDKVSSDVYEDLLLSDPKSRVRRETLRNVCHAICNESLLDIYGVALIKTESQIVQEKNGHLKKYGSKKFGEGIITDLLERLKDRKIVNKIDDAPEGASRYTISHSKLAQVIVNSTRSISGGVTSERKKYESLVDKNALLKKKFVRKTIYASSFIALIMSIGAGAAIWYANHKHGGRLEGIEQEVTKQQALSESLRAQVNKSNQRLISLLRSSATKQIELGEYISDQSKHLITKTKSVALPVLNFLDESVSQQLVNLSSEDWSSLPDSESGLKASIVDARIKLSIERARIETLRSIKMSYIDQLKPTEIGNDLFNKQKLHHWDSSNITGLVGLDSSLSGDSKKKFETACAEQRTPNSDEKIELDGLIAYYEILGKYYQSEMACYLAREDGTLLSMHVNNAEYDHPNSQFQGAIAGSFDQYENYYVGLSTYDEKRLIWGKHLQDSRLSKPFFQKTLTKNITHIKILHVSEETPTRAAITALVGTRDGNLLKIVFPVDSEIENPSYSVRGWEIFDGPIEALLARNNGDQFVLASDGKLFLVDTNTLLRIGQAQISGDNYQDINKLSVVRRSGVDRLILDISKVDNKALLMTDLPRVTVPLVEIEKSLVAANNPYEYGKISSVSISESLDKVMFAGRNGRSVGVLKIPEGYNGEYLGSSKIDFIQLKGIKSKGSSTEKIEFIDDEDSFVLSGYFPTKKGYSPFYFSQETSEVKNFYSGIGAAELKKKNLSYRQKVGNGVSNIIDGVFTTFEPAVYLGLAHKAVGNIDGVRDQYVAGLSYGDDVILAVRSRKYFSGCVVQIPKEMIRNNSLPSNHGLCEGQALKMLSENGGKLLVELGSSRPNWISMDRSYRFLSVSDNIGGLHVLDIRSIDREHGRDRSMVNTNEAIWKSKFIAQGANWRVLVSIGKFGSIDFWFLSSFKDEISLSRIYQVRTPGNTNSQRNLVEDFDMKCKEIGECLLAVPVKDSGLFIKSIDFFYEEEGVLYAN